MYVPLMKEENGISNYPFEWTEKNVSLRIGQKYN